ncbi:hypothetical protein NDU88_001315 [Pleurodeles waltl]|uniref:Uncharacterized protein n=1 Tax=Pleurodeles waltl TaxID=8319 RepID=A0AAV7KP99_PLEWA|nr:hypothetical protein NDU88_001315 [Pleurodeles waltl]
MKQLEIYVCTFTSLGYSSTCALDHTPLKNKHNECFHKKTQEFPFLAEQLPGRAELILRLRRLILKQQRLWLEATTLPGGRKNFRKALPSGGLAHLFLVGIKGTGILSRLLEYQAFCERPDVPLGGKADHNGWDKG